MSKHKIWVGALTIIISIFYIGCTNKAENFNYRAVEVKTDQVKQIDGNEVLDYSGTIEESESIPLSFAVIGTVAKVFVSEGDFVKKGQLLAVVNDETYKNAYEMTLSLQKQAEDAYNRLLPMYKNGNLPEIKLVEVETGLQQAKSAALIAKKNVEDCNLYTPVDGIVGKRSIEPGMSAIPNLTSINIVKIEKVFARVPVSESEISSIKNGDKAKIKIGALNYAEYIGMVEEIGVMADPIAHTYKIKIGISNKNLLIKPGMICNVTLYRNKTNKTTGVFVPSRAVLVDDMGKTFVYAISENKAVIKYVITGKLLKDGVEVTSGLNYGEQIVVTGHQKLFDNALIQIVNR